MLMVAVRGVIYVMAVAKVLVEVVVGVRVGT